MAPRSKARRLADRGERTIRAIVEAIEVSGRVVAAIGIVAFLSTLSAVTTIAEFLTDPDRPGLLKLVSGVAALVVGVLALLLIPLVRRVRRAELDAKDSAQEMQGIVDLMGEAAELKVVTRPSRSQTLAGVAIIRDHFGDAALSDGGFLAAQEANPGAIIVALEGERVVGIADYHGLRESAFQPLLSGELGENELRPTDFLPRDRFPELYRLYLGGLSVARDKLNHPYYVGEIVRGLLLGLSKEVLSVLDSSEPNRRIEVHTFAYPRRGRAESDSIKMLDNMGFGREGPGKDFPIFVKSYNVKELHRLRTRWTNSGRYRIALD